MSRFTWLEAAIQRSFEYSERHLTAIGFVCLIGLPLAAFIEQLVANPAINTLPLRTGAGLIGGALVLYSRSNANIQYYWIFSMTFVLPFCFGLLLILNAAYTPAGGELSSIWVYQYLVALFFFVNLIHHGYLSTVLWILASTISVLLIYFVPSPNWTVLKDSVLLPLPVYLTAVVIGSLMNRNVAMVQIEKVRAASAIGANLAHELRTPLASISSISKGVKNCLPTLTNAYNKAKAAGMEVAPLRESQLVQLTAALDSIRNEVLYSNSIIDMLLVNTADKSLRGMEESEFAVAQAINEAVSRYPFNNKQERELITVNIKQDFEVVAPRLLVIHVLFNLIKNSLFFVQKSGGGEIIISAEIQGDQGKLVVHDTGVGIPPAVQSHIFERFYTTTHTGQGAGIGLSFCRLVMESIGGSISCDSQEDEYTTFTLSFPDIKA